MIVFLTLCYVAVLAIAIKMGAIKLTLFWKLSPVLWMILLFVALFLPMQWGAPGGPVNVYQYVVEVIPNVTGEVIEVPVKPLEPLKRGDVLFKIDPVPFQATVDRIEAQLEQTIQEAQQLHAVADAASASVLAAEQEIDIQKANAAAAAAKVIVAQKTIEQSDTGVDRATTLVADFKTQAAAARREWDRRKELLSKGAASKSEVDQSEVQYTSLASQLNTSKSDLEAAIQELSSSRANLEFEESTSRSAELKLKQLIDAELPRAKANEREARLAAESMIGDEHTSVAVVRAQLVAAKFDLDNTVVRAPSEGHVLAVTLRPGQRVANFPVRSWMAFIDEEKTEIVVSVKQYALRFVQPGQKVEVTFKLFPGKVFNATVNRIAYSNAAGQLSPSGHLTSLEDSFDSPMPYGVVLDLDDDRVDATKLAGGASGSAAIYTDSMQATHVIRRVMIRMDAWLNYIMP